MDNQPVPAPARRALLRALGGVALGGLFTRSARANGGLPVSEEPAAAVLRRTIPVSGETIPAVGMGTWITFNVGRNPELRRQRARVLETFFAQGGGMIDSSPMYGSSEEVVGHCLREVRDQGSMFSATKVWTWRSAQGPGQIADSLRLWGIPRFDLIQVHNLLNWESHLRILREHREKGLIRYIGVTTSHGRRHADLEAILRNERVDFVQLTYNVLDREAETRLLPLARDRGIAVIVNRPFRQKELFNRFGHRPLPDWAAALDIANWAQFFLKFIISHEAVTCAIPATSKVEHMLENMGALHGRMPDERERRRMVQYVNAL